VAAAFLAGNTAFLLPDLPVGMLGLYSSECVKNASACGCEKLVPLLVR
jgi:hypothetical protein